MSSRWLSSPWYVVCLAIVPVVSSHWLSSRRMSSPWHDTVHLRCTFESTHILWLVFQCYFQYIIFGNIVGRCRLHIMAPDRNSAYRNYSLTRVGSFFCEGREACTHCWPLANSHLITLCTQQYEWPLASLFKVSFKLCKLYRP